MNKSFEALLPLLLFAILWACKPISYPDLARNQSIREKTIVLRGGQKDSRSKTSTDESAFIYPIRDSQLSDQIDIKPYPKGRR